MGDAIERLSRHIKPPPDERQVNQRRQVVMQMATVTDDSPFTIELSPDDEPIPEPGYLDSYTPNTGDMVLCAMWDSNLVVLGKVVS